MACIPRRSIQPSKAEGHESIWYYEQHHRRAAENAEAVYRMDCVFCRTDLLRDKEDEQKVEVYDTLNYGMSDRFTTNCTAVIGICPG